MSRVGEPWGGAVEQGGSRWEGEAHGRTAGAKLRGGISRVLGPQPGRSVGYWKLKEDLNPPLDSGGP